VWLQFHTLQAAQRDAENTQLDLIAQLQDTSTSLADRLDQQLGAIREQIKQSPKVCPVIGKWDGSVCYSAMSNRGGRCGHSVM
jgi:hypothetical protein